MALVIGPLGGSAASGKIAGQVYARNRAGQYSRGWAKPVNPASDRQTVVRSMFAGASAGWAMLTLAQILAWDAYAQLLVRLNRLGQAYTPKGRQVYMETANNLQQVGTAKLTNPSAFTDNPSVEVGEVPVAEETGGILETLSINKINAVVPSGNATAGLIVEATPPHDPKLTNVNNLYRQIYTVNNQDVTDGGPVDLLDEYLAVFGSEAPLNSIIDIRVRVVDTLSGLGSTYYNCPAVVVAA